jgi:hypothetical protein
MPQIATTLRVSGTVAADSDGTMLVLSERLDGHDTFLTGKLELDPQTIIAVRILTLDDVTVLRLTDERARPLVAAAWVGTLHLPHGWRPPTIPEDLSRAAAEAGRDLSALDDAETRYALTFLDEATTSQIRSARLEVIVNALPASGQGSPA